MAKFKSDSNINTLIIAATAAIGIAYFIPRYLVTSGSTTATAQATNPASTPATPGTAASTNAGDKSSGPALPRAIWAASAPGRIEPKGGEVRITAQMPGRITEVLAAVNDKVQAGDLLIKLDSSDLEARVVGAEAEAAVRRRDRDQEKETVSKLAAERRTAEDAAATAERQLANQRIEFDRVVRAHRNGKATAEDLKKSRDLITAARDKFDAARTQSRKVLSTEGLPLQTRLEAALAAARAELSLADSALERAHIRAPKTGSVLQVFATVGEGAQPSPENVQIIMGDVTSLRVRAEIEERDSGKIRVGQIAIVRSDAAPGKDFEGKVSTIAQALTSSRLGAKGPRKPTDVDVLEIFIDLDGQPALLPGMRVDVFLKPDSTAQMPAKIN
jgi:HlyD family secretion protein